ncbi:MAG: hypothetical protein U9R24_04360 [Thermodesulfobacteriota bacterium]|nr:hypothetical protein [Thermodesulfobacteriota bacterium]
MIKKYNEVILEGALALIKGFVIGFLEGSKIEGEAIFSEDHHIENEGAFGQLMRLVGIRGDQIHLIIGAGFHELLSEALKKRQNEINIKIVSVKEISMAYFDFSYKAFKKELGDELKEIFGRISRDPEGLHMEAGYKPEEKIRPEGKGVETYAPLHEYELNATGRIHGPVKDVIDFYGVVEHYDMVELGNIKIEYSD